MAAHEGLQANSRHTLALENDKAFAGVDGFMGVGDVEVGTGITPMPFAVGDTATTPGDGSAYDFEFEGDGNTEPI